MTATHDVTVVDAQIIADLRRDLDALAAQLVEERAQRSAMTEVLGVINASTGDLSPIFDAILDRATSLCRPALGMMWTYDGEQFLPAAVHGPTPFVEFYRDQKRLPPVPGSGLSRHVLGEDIVKSDDIADEPLYKAGNARRRAFVELGGARSAASLALRRGDKLVGAIQVYRQEVRPFSELETMLLSDFAAQAVIAMENAQLLGELRATTAELAERNSEYSERIAHQSATIDVLKTMSASPGDPQPVFDLIVRQAQAQCSSANAALYEYDGMIHCRSIVSSALSPDVIEAYVRRFPMPLEQDPNNGVTVSIRDRRIVHVRDASAEQGVMSDVVRDGGVQSAIAVPLIRADGAVGCILLSETRIGGYSDSQVALLQTFAEQAVIAISSAETYRALRTRTADLQESLEYQTATSDVLKVISRSTFDLQPVLDTVVEAAARLCDAEQAAIFRREDKLVRLWTNFGFPPEYEAFIKAIEPFPIDPASPSVGHRALAEGRPILVHDVAAVPGYHEASIRLGKQRTSLGIPLMREGKAIGTIVLARQRVEPFTDRQIELVSTFADQAVIAIENTRLITEQREALEQQTATAEVLQVINTSPGNLAPVFDAILEKAHDLCGATKGGLVMYDGEHFRVVATRGLSESYAQLLRQPHQTRPDSPRVQLLSGADHVHQVDLAEETHPTSRAAFELEGARTMLFVPLRREGALLGYITAYRLEVQRFAEKHIALLKNFADQAVIAIENARLLTEQREALEQQTATAEMLQVINASPGHLAPVFDAMLERALRLCGAAFGVLHTYDGERFQAVALRGLPAAYAAIRRDRPLPTDPDSRTGQMLVTGRPVQVVDVMTDLYFVAHPDLLEELVNLGGARSVLSLPLLKDGTVVGAFVIYRKEPGVWSDKQVALLENFAAQAVIAMENARLITEQREALEQQTATAEVLQVINASPGDLAPVFDAILDKAMRLCGAAFGSLYTYDGESFYSAAHRGVPKAYVEWRERVPPSPQTTVPARLLEEKRSIHVVDLMQEEDYTVGDVVLHKMLELGGIRTALSVPLLKDDAVLGFITIFRQEVRPFSDKQIAVLESFAAQAVVAMENARLLNEVRQRQEELRVTFENMGDGVAMFDETHRLVAWNGKFQEIYDLPDVLLEQHRTYEEHLRFLAARGDFGADVNTAEQIGELVASTGQPYGYERTRPDGRVIEIRRNPVPDGGFVLIFSDITERKRSEAEIRAARDAAEAAYRELKAAQANLIQAEKMASLGQLTAGIAHEIKNPLNFVNNFAALSVDLLSELKETAAPAFAALTDNQRAEIEDVSSMLTSNLQKIAEHGQRADGIVKAMLEHSRGSSGERRTVDMNALIDEALNLAYHGARAQDQSFNITLERDFGEGIAPIEINPQDMTRVFLNIFSNGFYAATKRARNGGSAEFTPTLKVTTRDAGEALEICVRDNGTGIPPDIKDKLFQPFFTTKPTGEGTGLGLSITYDIVTQQHGGSIAVDSKVGEYSEFTIRLPRNP